MWKILLQSRSHINFHCECSIRVFERSVLCNLMAHCVFLIMKNFSTLVVIVLLQVGKKEVLILQ